VKKKGLTNATNFIFKNTQNSLYLEKKNLEVPKFKQCVLAGR
jgi:hypothetical protein